MNINSFLWTIPFLIFLVAYWFTACFFGNAPVNTPALIGLDIGSACYQLSSNNLNMRIIGQKEDLDLPANIIIQQTPGAGQIIKPNQSVFCHITKRPEPRIAPNLVNKPINQIMQINDTEARLVTHLVPGSCNDICIGQIPAPGALLPDNKLIVLVAKNIATIALFPNLIGKPASDAQEWFKEKGYKVELFHKYHIDVSNHQCNCIIIAQKPIAGTLVDLTKPLSIQLIVS